MFQETMCPSSGETTVFDVTLSTCYSMWMTAYQTVIHKYQVSHKNSCFSW